jgi:DNA-binding NarL/FixJ family response regulator
LLEHIERLVAEDAERHRGGASFGDRISLLTPTEKEVLDALIHGKTIKDVAHARKIAAQTVWRHQVSIFRKIGVESQIELVRIATQWQMQHGQESPIADH